MKITLRASLLIMAAVTLSGCGTVRNVTDEATADIIPKSYTDGAPSPFTANENWWKEFNSEELNSLIGTVLKNNLSIATALSRVDQAKASLKKAGGGEWPQISVSGRSAYTEREKAAAPESKTSSEYHEANVTLSYELDLWKRLGSLSKSALLESLSSEQDLHVARIAAASEAALLYMNLVNTRSAIDLVTEQVKTAENILELVEIRFRQSQASLLDVLQQKENLASVRAVLPTLEAKESELLNSLAFITATPDPETLNLTTRILPDMPELPATGVPMDLLDRRPDIISARLKLESASALLSAARSARLPSITITASAGYGAADISDLLDSWIANLAAGILGPIIDGGKRRAEVERSEAVIIEKTASYKSVILRAVYEVRNAISNEQSQNKYIKALNSQLTSALLSHSEAVERYKSGTDSYLASLASLQRVQTLQRQKLTAELKLTTHRIQLYKALAGEWRDSDSKPGDNK